ncbi:hypothetical protein M413DRAFT_31068 [Hebeloma cylindrosporum]|uniref:BTB domain-containing protein n=1 Tax=Hebeloma cylindrosporum TaxID=76867 RepID=A0A0C2Y7Z8_HEBCY|nr:hypothetical protein M413DRAFT_31068 [Hebeloma cylindrosporum h7]
MAQSGGLVLATPPPPGLQVATKNSTHTWQENLESLFHHAKDRFPDVVWELGGEEEGESRGFEDVWGHKAIVYARAPPSFQNRYFPVRPNGASSPTPYSSSPNFLGESALSLTLEGSFRAGSPSTTVAPVGPTTLLRISTSINPALFSNELEYLYTGKGFGEAFEFLFYSSESRELPQGELEDPEALRIDKLRKDLVFMWRSRLYSDVRIALTGNFGGNHESTTAIFSSHRFILVSRSSYFHTALISWPSPKNAATDANEPPMLTLPSPPFTPASLHFTLGFIYTGTLIFSHRTYDLSTAFAILRSALYLSLTTLHDEIQARIVQEMLHGLFHAFISFAEYEGLTGGKWGTGGCRCRQCARRAPRVLEFALEEDVKNVALERGARRALVGLFGEGWCTQEFAGLPQKIRESVLKGVGKRTTPPNAFPLLFAAEHALVKLANSIEPWADVVRDMIFAGRKGVDELLCVESEPCFSSDEWMAIMENDGVRFDDGERVEWAMAAILRGVKEPNAPSLYQTLVSSILLRPHPTEVNAPLLPATSHVRVQEKGFDPLEGWALEEISDHIEVPIDDLLSPPSYSSPKKRQTGLLLRPISNHPHTSKVDADSDMASSMRVSVLSLSVHTRPSVRENNAPGSSASSVHSLARSTTSVSSTASTSTVSTARHPNPTGMSPARRIANDVRAGRPIEMKDRPDSKLTPSSSSIISRESQTPSPRQQPSIIEPGVDEVEEQVDEDRMDDEDEGNSIYQTPPPPLKKILITRASLASVTSRASTKTGSSVKSATPSVKTPVRKSTTTTSSSIRTTPSSASFTSSSRPSSRGSTHSTARSRLTVSTNKTGNAGPSTASRPTSRVSTRSISGGGGARPISTASTATETTGSYRTASTKASVSTPTARPRRTSTTSTASVRTGGGRSNTGSPVNERTRRISGASVSSVASNATSVRSTTRATPAKRIAPPVPTADPKKLSPASAATSKSRPVSSHSTASTVFSTPKKVVVVGTLGRKPIDEKKSMESTSTPEAPSAQPLPTSNANPIEAESEKENQTPASPPPVPVEPLPIPISAPVAEAPVSNTSSVITIRPAIRPEANSSSVSHEHKKTSSSASTSSVATLKRKNSTDTIKITKSSEPVSNPSQQPPRQPLQPQPPATQVQPSSPPVVNHASSATQPRSIEDVLANDVPQGSTLDIGIPCIISSKRKRFKAYARYIGEVLGESGPWVGVEVPIPIGDANWGDREGEKPADDRQWNDGSWGGVRYFAIGGMQGGSEYGDDRMARRRRIDAGSVGGAVWGRGEKGVLKREGDQLSISSERMKRMRSVSPAVSEMSGTESRGLFVRPQQVLYVVDAVDSDL